MKKIIFALCTVAMFSMAACSKDDDKKVNNNPTGNDGIFNPTCKISSINFSNEDESTQTWNWDGNKLIDITTDGEITEFAYDGDRLGKIRTKQTEQTFNYNANNFITSIVMKQNGSQVFNATIDHNANQKISHMNIDIDRAHLSMLMGMFSGFDNIFDSNATDKGSRKLNVNQYSVNADLVWSGDNVSQMMLNIDMQITTSLSELPRELLESQLGEATDMVIAMVGNKQFPVTITMRDTTSYTYDAKHNPMCGFLGDFDPANLSANNVTRSVENNKVNISATLPIVNQNFNFDMPSSPEEKTFAYTYNSEGYPSTCTSSEGVKTFNYLSKK